MGTGPVTTTLTPFLPTTTPCSSTKNVGLKDPTRGLSFVCLLTLTPTLPPLPKGCRRPRCPIRSGREARTQGREKPGGGERGRVAGGGVGFFFLTDTLSLPSKVRRSERIWWCHWSVPPPLPSLPERTKEFCPRYSNWRTGDRETPH